MLVTAFRSPITAASLEASIPGSTFPTCYFASFSPLPLPVRPFSSATPCRLAPVRGCIVASGPLQSPRLVRRSRLQPPLPLGTFTSRRIKAFCWINNPSARLPNPPDLLRSPQPASIASVQATDHRSGSLRLWRLAVPQRPANQYRQAAWAVLHYSLLQASGPKGAAWSAHISSK